MIPIRSLSNDVALAFCVVAFSVGVIGLSTTTVAGSAHEISVTPVPHLPQIIVREAVPKSAPVDIPPLPVSTSTVLVSGTATTTRQASTSHSERVQPQHSTTAPKATPTKAVPKPVTPKTAPTPNPTQTDATYIAEVARLINLQTNLFRKTNDLSPLTLDTALTRNTTSYSRTLLAGHFLSHTDKKGCDMSCRFTRDGYTDAWAWGENLATLHFSDRPTAEYVASYFMQAWKKSAGHRENLLTSNYTHTGIGVAMDSHSIYVTAQFSKPK